MPPTIIAKKIHSVNDRRGRGDADRRDVEKEDLRRQRASVVPAAGVTRRLQRSAKASAERTMSVRLQVDKKTGGSKRTRPVSCCRILTLRARRTPRFLLPYAQPDVFPQ